MIIISKKVGPGYLGTVLSSVPRAGDGSSGNFSRILVSAMLFASERIFCDSTPDASKSYD
jgi:hypothetical protein